MVESCAVAFRGLKEVLFGDNETPFTAVANDVNVGRLWHPNRFHLIRVTKIL